MVPLRGPIRTGSLRSTRERVVPAPPKHQAAFSLSQPSSVARLSLPAQENRFDPARSCRRRGEGRRLDGGAENRSPWSHRRSPPWDAPLSPAGSVWAKNHRMPRAVRDPRVRGRASDDDLLADVRHGELIASSRAVSGAIVCDACHGRRPADDRHRRSVTGRARGVGGFRGSRAVFVSRSNALPGARAGLRGRAVRAGARRCWQSLGASDVQRSRLTDSGVASVTVPVDVLSGQDAVLEQPFKEVESRCERGDVVVS